MVLVNETAQPDSIMFIKINEHHNHRLEARDNTSGSTEIL